MPSRKTKPSPSDSADSPTRDRRGRFSGGEKGQETSSRVRFDEKGNPVFEIRTDTPRRRKDDDTIDLLKCLENESLSLEEDDS